MSVEMDLGGVHIPDQGRTARAKQLSFEQAGCLKDGAKSGSAETADLTGGSEGFPVRKQEGALAIDPGMAGYALSHSSGTTHGALEESQIFPLKDRGAY